MAHIAVNEQLPGIVGLLHSDVKPLEFVWMTRSMGSQLMPLTVVAC